MKKKIEETSCDVKAPPSPLLFLQSRQAFKHVDSDMCDRDIPMDRLICGDVGFGKTEVAMRAVFQALLDGRQVQSHHMRNITSIHMCVYLCMCVYACVCMYACVCL